LEAAALEGEQTEAAEEPEEEILSVIIILVQQLTL